MLSFAVWENQNYLVCMLGYFYTVCYVKYFFTLRLCDNSFCFFVEQFTQLIHHYQLHYQSVARVWVNITKSSNKTVGLDSNSFEQLKTTFQSNLKLKMRMQTNMREVGKNKHCIVRAHQRPYSMYFRTPCNFQILLLFPKCTTPNVLPKLKWTSISLLCLLLWDTLQSSNVQTRSSLH